ncbi:MAG: hypothetical protein AAF610_01030 [Pseudomonadota bacterium]
MKTDYLSLALAGSIAAVLVGCGEPEPPPPPPEPDREINFSMDGDVSGEQVEAAIGEFAKALTGDSVETVSTEVLREVLPKRLAGLDRSSLNASRNGMFGIQVSNAEAVYRDDAGGTLTVNVADIGSLQGVAAMTLDWIDSDFYEETETGFSRTVTYKGHRALESFDESDSGSQGSKVVFVADRYVVAVEGADVSFRTIEKALDSVSIDKLERGPTN